MNRWLLLIPLLPLLGGCFQERASYMVAPPEHGITVTRSQDWPWQSSVEVAVVVQRLPECSGGGSIAAVPEDAALTLYRAPDEYAEPIFMLQAGERVFAVSTLSCRMQAFAAAPANLGQRLGSFAVRDGRFQFVPAADEAGAGAG